MKYVSSTFKLQRSVKKNYEVISQILLSQDIKGRIALRLEIYEYEAQYCHWSYIFLMYYKQKFAQQNHILDLFQYNQPPENEERKLLTLWEQHAVEESYQNIVLAYFDQFSDRKQLAHEIKQEIKLTYTKGTHYFKIRNLLIERDKTIQYLYQWAAVLEKYKKITEKNQPNLEKVCDIIDHLRKVHMLICESVSQMFQRYKWSSKHSKDIQAGSYYLTIFATFNSDLMFLKDSLLKFYMPFSSGFDPLFLEQARQIGKLYAEHKIVYDSNVEALFNINASYLYRLLRAHQKMLEYISISQQKEDYDDSIDLMRNYDTHTGQSKINHVNQQKQIINVFPLSKESRHVQTELIPLKEKIVKDQRMKNNVQKHQQQKIKVTNFLHSQPLSLFINEDKPFSPPNLSRQSENDSQKTLTQDKIDKMNNIRHFQKDRQKQRQTTSPSTPSVQKDQFSNDRINTEIPKGLNKPIKRLPLSHESSEQKNSPIQNYVKKITYKRRSEPQISVTQSNIKQISLNVKPNNFYLPKINESLKNSKNQDCFCRKKYKSKRPQAFLEEEQQGEMSARRKAIIQLINAKYRRLSERQKRYELRKIKDKSLEKSNIQIQSKQQSRAIKIFKASQLSDNSLQKNSDKS